MVEELLFFYRFRSNVRSNVCSKSGLVLHLCSPMRSKMAQTYDLHNGPRYRIGVNCWWSAYDITPMVQGPRESGWSVITAEMLSLID